MARCGCNPICTCVIKAESTDPCLTLNIAGLGSPTNPYVFSGAVVVDNDTITCTGAGLGTTINTIDTDTVNITGDGSGAAPLQMDMILTPDGTGPLAGTPAGGFNLIDDLGPGLYVSCEEVQDCVLGAVAQILGDCMEYDDANNTANVQIAPEPNGIECGGPNGPGVAVVPSADPNNALGFGGDQRLFSPAPAPFQINPTPCIDAQVTGTGAPGNPQILTVNPIIDPNPCNALTCGPAGLLMPNQVGDFNAGLQQPGPAPGIGSPCFAIQEFPGCPVNYNLNLAISDDPCNALVCRADGLFVTVARGEACDYFGLSQPTPLPAGAVNAGQRVEFFSAPIQICNSSCCRTEGQFTITFAGINAFVDFNSVVRVKMALVSGPPFVFPPNGNGNTFPVDDQIYDTFLFNPGPPGFKNTPLQAQDSFWTILAPQECVTIQWRMSINVEQGRIRQFVTAPNSQGLGYQAIFTGYPECDCNCNGFVNPNGNGCPIQ